MEECNTRKNYLDNIRSITILLVVIFHIYFYYNNIGVEAMFKGAPAYTGQISFPGLFQYFVYPWFMLLLFVVAGMSARYALKTKTGKQFLRDRADKLLVPSTLGVLIFGWIGGYVIYLNNASVNMPASVPNFVRVIIVLCSGVGALWFCHVLFLASLILLLIRKILAGFHGTDMKVCSWFEKKTDSLGKMCVILVLLYLLLWGGSHILNMPMVTSYRNGIYIPGFLAGYYVFSNHNVLTQLKRNVLPLLLLTVAAGVFYMYRCYGLAYSNVTVLARWDLNLYGFLMVLLVLSAGAKFLDFSNGFTNYMKQCSFGIYVFHIPVLLLTNYLLVDSGLSMTVIYLIELISALVISILLYEIIHRIPLLRYWILGIRKKK